MKSLVIGVLALQGDVREHERAIQEAGAATVRVRRPADLVGLDGIVLPGGESTAITWLARTVGLIEPLRAALRCGLPAFGTCAGMVLLADRLEDGAEGQETLGGLDVTVRRNGFGRQVDSFEEDLVVRGLDQVVHGVFIRAPWVTGVGDGVEILARSSLAASTRASGSDPLRSAVEGDAGTGPDGDGRIVAVRQGVLMATSFHPEVGGDSRLHRSFLDLVRSA